MPANSILPPLAEEELIKKATAAWSSLFGSEDDRFTAGIKKRRLERESEEIGLKTPDDPTGFMGPNPEVMMAGVTKYLNSAGVPSRLERMVGTEMYKRGMERIGLKEIGEEFASRYPRIAAHITPYLETERGINGRVRIGAPMARTLPVGLNPAESTNLRGTMAHEATHVAQRLGMGDKMPNVYNELSEVAGYEDNPLEQSARRAAFRYAMPEGRKIVPPFKRLGY